MATNSAVLRGSTSARTRPARPVEMCSLCGGANDGEFMDAGGGLRRVHRRCFIEWDRQQEALEMSACVGLVGHPGEFWAELEMEDTPLARAA